MLSKHSVTYLSLVNLYGKYIVGVDPINAQKNIYLSHLSLAKLIDNYHIVRAYFSFPFIDQAPTMKNLDKNPNLNGLAIALVLKYEFQM